MVKTRLQTWYVVQCAVFIIFYVIPKHISDGRNELKPARWICAGEFSGTIVWMYRDTSDEVCVVNYRLS